MNTLFFLPVISFITHFGTDSEFTFKGKGIDEIRYNYYDSSVPPQFHRSYCIIVTNEKASIIVDSYGNIIADKQFACTVDQFNALIDLLDKCKIKNVKNKKENSCTGGTGEAITCLKAGSVIFKGNAFYCGGQLSGDMEGDIAGFTPSVVALITDFEKVLNR